MKFSTTSHSLRHPEHRNVVTTKPCTNSRRACLQMRRHLPHCRSMSDSVLVLVVLLDGVIPLADELDDEADDHEPGDKHDCRAEDDFGEQFRLLSRTYGFIDIIGRQEFHLNHGEISVRNSSLGRGVRSMSSAHGLVGIQRPLSSLPGRSRR